MAPADPAPEMADKVVVITGANSGIGKAAAVELARRGGTVVMVCRDPAKGEAAAAEVRAAALEAGGPAEGRVRLELADLAGQSEVRDLARRLQELDRLDVLINNAGLILGSRTVTSDGIETTFAVNHLAPFLLTNLLLDRLSASAPSRIVNVASTAHRAGGIDFDDLQMERGYGAQRAYNATKLANVLFTRELARRLAGTGVTANSVHPGTVRSGWGREAGFLMRIGVRIAGPFFISPEKGADTVLYLATSPEVAGRTGGYYVKRRERQPSKAALDDATARRLWDVSAELTGLDAS